MVSLLLSSPLVGKDVLHTRDDYGLTFVHYACGDYPNNSLNLDGRGPGVSFTFGGGGRRAYPPPNDDDDTDDDDEEEGGEKKGANEDKEKEVEEGGDDKGKKEKEGKGKGKEKEKDNDDDVEEKKKKEVKEKANKKKTKKKRYVFEIEQIVKLAVKAGFDLNTGTLNTGITPLQLFGALTFSLSLLPFIFSFSFSSFSTPSTFYFFSVSMCPYLRIFLPLASSHSDAILAQSQSL